jgi:arylformamidase
MELDDAYANAAHIPGAEWIFSRAAANARSFRAGLGERAQTGLSYGDGDRQTFDLFLPEGPAKGTVVFIHGGYWLKFDPGVFSHLAAGPLARGWAVAMPSYELCPAVRIFQITLQVAAAVQAVAALRQGPIAITGHSAGGHLAARMLDPALLPPEVAARIGAVVPISPVADLRPMLRTSMNADFGLDLAAAEAESPVLMQDRIPAAVTVWVGADERPAFLEQARRLAEAWGVDRVIVPDRHHFDVIEALTDAESDIVRRLTA